MNVSEKTNNVGEFSAINSSLKIKITINNVIEKMETPKENNNLDGFLIKYFRYSFMLFLRYKYLIFLEKN